MCVVIVAPNWKLENGREPKSSSSSNKNRKEKEKQIDEEGVQGLMKKREREKKKGFWVSN